MIPPASILLALSLGHTGGVAPGPDAMIPAQPTEPPQVDPKPQPKPNPDPAPPKEPPGHDCPGCGLG